MAAGKERTKKMTEFQYISPEDIKSTDSAKPLLLFLPLIALLVIIDFIPEDSISPSIIVLVLSFFILWMVVSIMVSVRNFRRKRNRISELTYTVILDDSSIKMNRMAEPHSTISEEWSNVIGMRATKGSESVAGFLGMARARFWFYGCVIKIRNKETFVFYGIERQILEKLRDAAKSHNVPFENASCIDTD